MNINKCVISNPVIGKSVTITNCSCNEIDYNTAGKRLEITCNFGSFTDAKTISDSLNFEIAKVDLYAYNEAGGTIEEVLIYSYTNYNDIDRKVLTFGSNNEAHLTKLNYGLYLLLV